MEASSGLSGLRAENCACVVLLPTNSIESSAIYKLRSCFADYLKFMDRGLSDWRAANWASVVPWSTNST
jgi:hypothetical protein